MQLLLDFLFSEEELRRRVFPQWLRHYDAEYIEHTLLPNLQSTKVVLSPLLCHLKKQAGGEGPRMLGTAAAGTPAGTSRAPRREKTARSETLKEEKSQRHHVMLSAAASPRGARIPARRHTAAIGPSAHKKAVGFIRHQPKRRATASPCGAYSSYAVSPRSPREVTEEKKREKAPATAEKQGPATEDLLPAVAAASTPPADGLHIVLVDPPTDREATAPPSSPEIDGLLGAASEAEQEVAAAPPGEESSPTTTQVIAGDSSLQKQEEVAASTKEDEKPKARPTGDCEERLPATQSHRAEKAATGSQRHATCSRCRPLSSSPQGPQPPFPLRSWLCAAVPRPFQFETARRPTNLMSLQRAAEEQFLATHLFRREWAPHLGPLFRYK